MNAGLGAFEQDGTASARQVQYIQSLLTGADYMVDGALAAPPVTQEQFNVASFRNDKANYRAQAEQSRVADTVGFLVEKGQLNGFAHYVEHVNPDAYRRVGYEVAQDARRWATTIDPSKLSRHGASTFIDAAKKGLVQVYLAAHGGATVQSRVEFINRTTSVHARAVPFLNRQGEAVPNTYEIELE